MSDRIGEHESSRQRMVTPFLFLGRAPRTLDGVVTVQTAEQAAEVLREGGTAVLPVAAWDEAERALLLIEANDPAAVHRQMRFARYGHLG